MASALRRSNLISKSDSRRLVLALARYGNNYSWPFGITEADAKFQIEHACGRKFEEVVARSRNPTETLPFENLVGSTWQTENVSVSRGNEKLVSGTGQFIESSYWGAFEHSWKCIGRAVDEGSSAEFDSALERGIASIEGYFATKANMWNKKNPDDPLIDSKSTKISLEDKFDLWVPKITGHKFDKGGESWSAFKVLKGIRDSQVTHPKSDAHGINLQDQAKLINLFSAGIARLLLELHIDFSDKVPRIIIRAAFFPKVHVQKE